jgi:hypothetical protein
MTILIPSKHIRDVTSESRYIAAREMMHGMPLLGNDSVIMSSNSWVSASYDWLLTTVLSQSVGRGACCRFSSVQSVLVSSPVGIHHLIYVRSKTANMFGHRVSSSARGRGGLVFVSRRHICCTIISHECTRTQSSVQVRAFARYGPHTSFATLLQWIILMQ